MVTSQSLLSEVNECGPFNAQEVLEVEGLDLSENDENKDKNCNNWKKRERKITLDAT